jgi:predicted NBD/HSP70 family sugar kinase
VSNQLDCCLAVDIGGSKIALGWFDTNGKLVGDSQNIPVPFDAFGQADENRIIDSMRRIIHQAINIQINILGLGVSVCGPVEKESGVVVLAPNLKWRLKPLKEIFQFGLKLPAHVEVDSRQAALAEKTWGAARNVNNFAWCTIGTGYGGYLFLDNKLFGGSRGFAGNFGHITHDEINGFPCGCGRKGCIETFVAGPAIARQGQAAVDSGQSEMMKELAGDKPVTTRVVVQARQMGDKSAIQIIDQVLRLVAINLGGVVNILDLEMIVMGGGIVNSLPDFVDQIQMRIRDHLMMDETKLEIKIVKESFSNASLYGAAADFFLKEGYLV